MRKGWFLVLVVAAAGLAGCGNDKKANISLPATARAGWTPEVAQELLECRDDSGKMSQRDVDRLCDCYASQVTPRYSPDEYRQAKADVNAQRATPAARDIVSIASGCLNGG